MHTNYPFKYPHSLLLPHTLFFSTTSMESLHVTNASSAGEPVAGKLPSALSTAVLRRPFSPLTLTFDDVAYSIGSPEKKVLKGITGVAMAGELLAMLGPSGGGKTTLLTAVAGRLQGKFSGEVLYNGGTISAAVRRRVGFVTQEDVLYPHLTVMETLTFTAFLRLPAAVAAAEKVAAAEAVAEELSLTGCGGGMVGGGVVRGISGGERRRVSIGQEMLLNPSLLLLDEPTSGLDSTTAHRLMATLLGMARAGRTVVTTVHQPSSRMFRMFDRLLVLCDGAPIYMGQASRVMEYFGSVGFEPGFHMVNPADFALDLANGIAGSGGCELEAGSERDGPDEVKNRLISSYRKILAPSLKQQIAESHIPETKPPRKGKKTNQPHAHTTRVDPYLTLKNEPPAADRDDLAVPWFDQVRVLVRRGVRERKHESFSKLRVFQVVSVAVLCSIVWWRSDPSHIQDRVGLLFFFSIFWGFLPLSTAVFAFPQEWPNLLKESSSGTYSLSSYFVARTVGDLPMEMLLPTVFVTITYWASGLDTTLFAFFFTVMVVLLNVVVAHGLGLAMGAVLMDVRKGATLSSVTMLAFLLVSGYYIETMRPYVAWSKYISYSHYCFELLVAGQYSRETMYTCGPDGITCRVADFPPVKCLDIDRKVFDVAVLVFMMVGFRVVAYFVLRKRLAV